MALKRRASAEWQGTGLEGQGTLTTMSGAFQNHPYSTKLRFQNEDGTLNVPVVLQKYLGGKEKI